jgi:malate/lactate dehydrogenase
LVFMIGQGRLFGPNQPVDLTLLEVPVAENQMKATIMELNDCVYPLLNSVRGSVTYEDGFKDCEMAILVGAKPRGPGM